MSFYFPTNPPIQTGSIGNHCPSPAHVIKTRQQLIETVQDIWDLTAAGDEAAAVVDELISQDYLSGHAYQELGAPE